MKKIVLLLLAVVAWSWNDEVSAQNIAAVKSRLATGKNPVSVVEQSDASMAVRTIEQKPKREKVTGYTILLLSDNSHQAREKAVAARDLFRDTFVGVNVEMYYESPSFYVTAGRYLTKEEAIIELWRFRAVFPKAITQNREFDITDFIIRPEKEIVEPELSDEEE
jgi:hypothetical protein